MEFKRVSIIGVGLIGGSFALSLKKHGFKGSIIGIGRKIENLIKAKESEIIDKYTTIASEGVKDADLILLSAPVGQFVKIIMDIRENIKRGTIITDVGSVKAEVIKKLEPLMPEGVSFIGGHPIAGRECSGVECASADILKNARCIITPTPNTDRDILEKIINLWKTIGANPVLMSPDEHDSIFAAVSHLPHVLAYILINTIMDFKGNIIQNGGRGLRDMTRIALSSPEMWRDICAYNKENILESLNQFLSSVMRIKKIIENSEWDNLEKEFHRAKAGRQILESA